jgi:cobalt-zinc-cadmium efflux system outer membrane protein
MARVEAQEATFAGRAEAAIVDLSRIVGLPSANEIAIPTDFALSIEDRSLGQWQERALTQRADLRAARLSEEQALAEVTLTRAQGVPDVTASARYARRNSFFDDQLALSPAGVPVNLRDRDNVLTFGVAIPLFTGRRNQGNIEAGVARQNAARLRREFLESAIPAEVEAAYRRVTAARRALDLFQRGVVAQSERNLTVIREAYTLGQLRVLDVLNEQRRLIDTELAYIDAQTDFAQALAELERTTGGNLP